MRGSRSLAMVSDEAALDELLKLAAAAGCELERVPDAAAARTRWSSAPLVIVDERGARSCHEARLARRGRVVLVSSAEPRASTWQCAVALGAEQVLRLPAGGQWLANAFADVAEGPACVKGRVLSVLGGRGGAGASVLAAAIGLAALRRDRDALLVDCDPLAGGLDLVLGSENEHGLRWPDMRVRSGRVSAAALRSALPGRTKGNTRLTLLSGTRQGYAPEPDAVAAVVEAGRRAGEIVVCDLPRELPAAARTALDLADLAVVIVPAELRACVAAKRVAERVLDRGIPARLLVRGPAPGALRPEEIAAAVGLPLLASMAPQPGIARALEHGEFARSARGPLATAANTVLDALTSGTGPLDRDGRGEDVPSCAED